MRSPLLLALLCSLSTSAAWAQRTTNNAVTSATDAFGRVQGNERIGIYAIEDVRGFSAVDAGNVRIEGLYYDQQTTLSNRVVDSSTVRVGYAARGYPFPAPTGIAELALEKWTGETVLTIEGETDDRGNISGSVQAKIGFADNKFGIALGQGFRFARQPHGRFGDFNSTAAMLSWKPDATIEATLLASRFHGVRVGANPIIFPGDDRQPARITRTGYLGQRWAKSTNTGYIFGGIVHARSGALQIDAGIFRSERDDPLSFADLLTGARRDRSVASRVLIADDDNHAGSTSGEIRIARAWQSDAMRHGLTLSLRGRDQARSYGGQQRIVLGASRTDAPDDRAQPAISFGENDHSAVRQFTPGLAYTLDWAKHATLAVSIQKAFYRKQTAFANAALAPVQSRDQPWLPSVSGGFNLTSRLTVYAGYVRGLEESPVAPDIATNRNEAPPAVRTRQADAGLRYALTDHLSLIGGVFELRKPYFNLDTALQFRQLGVITNRGIELSLAGTPAKGLTVVAGALFLDPSISGEDVRNGRLGPRPVGSSRRRSIVNLDWKPAGQTAWSFDLAFEDTSAAIANARNSFHADARETLSLGLRYRFAIGKAKALVRGQVLNITNDYGWKVSGSGGFTFTQPRTFVLNLATDI